MACARFGGPGKAGCCWCTVELNGVRHEGKAGAGVAACKSSSCLSLRPVLARKCDEPTFVRSPNALSTAAVTAASKMSTLIGMCWVISTASRHSIVFAQTFCTVRCFLSHSACCLLPVPGASGCLVTLFAQHLYSLSGLLQACVHKWLVAANTGC